MTFIRQTAVLLGCLALAACSGMATTAPPGAAAAAAPAAPAAAPATSPAAAAPEPAEPIDPHADPLTQARVDCWMKVEHQRQIRDIDRRIVFVDKCVADTMKGKPPR